MDVWIRCFLSICTVAWGAYVDYKERVIPDEVPLSLLIIGLFSGNIPFRFLTMFLTLGVLLIAEKLSGQPLPGGDLKLLCTLAFSAGLFDLLIVLFLAGLASVIVGLVKREPLSRHIPLCTYIAPAYILLCAIQLF